MKFREIRRIILEDGWRLARTSGSHEIYTHPHKRGIVVIAAGHGDNRDVPPGTLRSILAQAQIEHRR